MLSLRRHLEGFGLLHLDCVDGWLDMCVHNLFNDPTLLRRSLRRSEVPVPRSALLCIVNVGLLDHFVRFFIRELLTHICLHVALILCRVWGCRLNSLSDRMDNFSVLQSQPRVFSLSVIALSKPLSLNFARWFTTADNSVFTFVSVFSRVLN